MPITLSDFTALDRRAMLAGMTVSYHHETYILKRDGQIIKETDDFVDALLCVAEAKWAIEAEARANTAALIN